MRSSAGRIALGIALVGLAVVLLIVLSDGDGDGNGEPAPGAGTGGDGDPAETRRGYGDRPQRPAAPAVPIVRVRGGEPVGGVERLEFTAGERVRFVVESDVAEEIHVHGYDIVEDVPAGGEARFDFPADLEGVYEVELHGSGAEIAELRVSP